MRCRVPMLLFVLCTLCASALPAQEELEFQAARSARRATAYRRLIDAVNQNKFAQVSDPQYCEQLEQTLIGLLRQALQTSDAPRPLEMPEPQEIDEAGALRQAVFQKLLDRQIAESVAGLDDTTYKLSQWLRAQAGQGEQRGGVIKRAQAQFDAAWEKVHQEASAAAQQKLRALQWRQVASVLAEKLRSGLIQPAEIERLAAASELRVLYLEQLEQQVRSSFDALLTKTYLRETHQQLEHSIDRAVSDALSQWSERDPRQRLGHLEALTLAGLERELQAWVAHVRKQQLAARQQDPLLLAIDIFPQTETRIADTTLEQFDAYIAQAVEQSVSALDSGQALFPEDYRQEMHSALGTNPLHHLPQRSLELLLGTPEHPSQLVETLLANQQDALASALAERAVAANCPFDQLSENRLSAQADLARAISQRIADPGVNVVAGRGRYDRRAAAAAWQDLAECVRKQAQTEIELVRRELAQEQAQQHSLLLMADWKPDERLLRGYTPALLERDRRYLQSLPVWATGKPPADAAVLAETWMIWQEAARKFLGIGQEAYHRQADVVIALRPVMSERIQAARLAGDPQALDEPFWIDQYQTAVISDWTAMAATTPAAARYSQLFSNTVQQIKDICRALLRERPELVQVESLPVTESGPEHSTSQASDRFSSTTTDIPADVHVSPGTGTAVAAVVAAAPAVTLAPAEPAATRDDQVPTSARTSLPSISAPSPSSTAGQAGRAGGEENARGTSAEDVPESKLWLWLLLVTLLLCASIGFQWWQAWQAREWRWLRGVPRSDRQKLAQRLRDVYQKYPTRALDKLDEL